MIIRPLLIFFFAFLSGCAEYCEDQIESALFEYQWSPDSRKSESLGGLSRALWICNIPERGVADRFGYYTHAAQIYFILNRYEDASEALDSDDYTLSEDQTFDLLSFAVTHNDGQVLDIVLSAGLDPVVLQPNIGTTVLMHASQSEAGATERMRRLVELGNDPLAVTEGRFSVLDFAIAAENDEAVNLILVWFGDAGLASLDLVEFSITVADKTGFEGYSDKLRAWLVAQNSGAE